MPFFAEEGNPERDLAMISRMTTRGSYVISEGRTFRQIALLNHPPSSQDYQVWQGRQFPISSKGSLGRLRRSIRPSVARQAPAGRHHLNHIHRPRCTSERPMQILSPSRGNYAIASTISSCRCLVAVFAKIVQPAVLCPCSALLATTGPKSPRR
jgi:hypothetical protein